MRTIGFVFDLRDDYLKEGYSEEETAEFDKASTIDGIEQALIREGFRVVRIGNARSLMQRLLNGERWDLVFNIAEGLYGDGRESLVPALLDMYRIPYVFSGPATLAISLNKAFAKQIVRDSGVPTAPFYLVHSPEDLDNITLEYPLFAKPVAEGTGKGISEKSVVHTPAQLKEICEYLLEAYHQPVLVEEFLPGREFTIGVIGTGREAYVPGGMEIVCKNPGDVYSWHTKEHYEDLVEYVPIEGELLKECTAVALGAWRALHCHDGGRVDVKMDRHGRVCFLEVNPLAGLNPISSDLPILCRLNGISYQELIHRIMSEAMKRIFGDGI